MIVMPPGAPVPGEKGKTMSEFKVTLAVKVKASDVYQALTVAQAALRAGVAEHFILSGEVTGEPEECLCLTTRELNARIKAAVEAATGTKTSDGGFVDA